MSRTRGNGWIVATTLGLAAILFIACGGSSNPPAASRPEPPRSTTSSTPAFRDVEPTAADFVNINRMARVGDHFLGSLNGHLDAVLAVARDPDGGDYPVGTIIQLLPQEAMVKRREGFSPATNDWEFFFLTVSPDGTVIETRGAEGVVNRFGGNCASCHAAAGDRFDFVCEDDHGCAPLPIGEELFTAIQEADPRPI